MLELIITDWKNPPSSQISDCFLVGIIVLCHFQKHEKIKSLFFDHGKLELQDAPSEADCDSDGCEHASFTLCCKISPLTLMHDLFCCLIKYGSLFPPRQVPLTILVIPIRSVCRSESIIIWGVEICIWHFYHIYSWSMLTSPSLLKFESL